MCLVLLWRYVFDYYLLEWLTQHMTAVAIVSDYKDAFLHSFAKEFYLQQK